MGVKEGRICYVFGEGAGIERKKEARHLHSFKVRPLWGGMHSSFSRTSKYLSGYL